MFLVVEEQTANIYARKRADFDVHAEVVERDSDEWQKIMSLFDQIDGELIQTLLMLGDFQLIRLNRIRSLFDKYFGKVFQISGKKMDHLSNINPQK